MAKQLTISNGIITAVLSSKGAELKSVKKNGTEILWEGNSDVWAGQAPVLFPICGGLKDDMYILNGKVYHLQKHGYARFLEFWLEKSTDNSATFLLCSDKDSYEKYPFEYEFRITYTLIENKIEVRYDVTNIDKKDMYFSIGSHEGYACPEGIEEYSLIFDKEENLTCNVLDGNVLLNDTYSVGESTNELPLKYEYFSVDALTLLNLKSRKVSLVHRSTGRKIDVEFGGFDYLFVWTKPDAKYICIEPWCGIPDFFDSDYDFIKKRGIIMLPSGNTDTRIHNIIL